MKTVAPSKVLLLLCCLFSLSQVASAVERHISLKKAMSSKLITVTAVSTGGYCAKSLKLKLKNNSPRLVNVDIDPGMIFQPEDTSMQDLVLYGNESFVLSPSADSDITLQTFCGKSYAHSPLVNQPYHFLRQGDSNMIRTLNYAKTNNLDVQLVQNAVWVFTNHHSLSSVYAYAYPRESESLGRFLASMMKLKLPEYFIQYKTETRAGQPVISPKQTKLYAVMHWGAGEGFRNMHLIILHENGTVYKTIEADQVIDKYGYTVKVEFDPRRDPKGTYLVKLYDDANKIWDQKKVVLDPDEYEIR
jgi:hypothetical protein